jgi:SAM-dependent methyltransferase
VTPVVSEEIIILKDHELPYRDGAEERLVEIISSAEDLSSDSDELVQAAGDWADKYHLDPARANVLRVFDLSSSARVLEVGGGCGAITRYLGETVAHVDSVEPVPARARVARLRCRDLVNVDVYVGLVEDVPTTSTYDYVVVVGVFEYTGDGSEDERPYRDFLQRCYDLLTPEGSLILAIENKIGVKYLSGAPEDHYGTSYEGVEGYPHDGTFARTFSRRELESMLQATGFSATTLAAFPDYKLTRGVFDADELVRRGAQTLLTSVPSFPSPDWVGSRDPSSDEGRLWESLVKAGLAAEFPNSFVVIASKGDVARSSALWPDSRSGRYFSWNRRSEFSNVTTIDGTDEGIVLTKSPLHEVKDRSALHVHGSQQKFAEGTLLSDLIASSEVARARELLEQWQRFVESQATDGLLDIDLVPHNILVQAGDFQAIDCEWYVPGITAESVVRRGVLLSALRFGQTGRRPLWAEPAAKAYDAAVAMGAWLGLGSHGEWIKEAVAEESAFQATVSRPLVGAGADPVAESRIAMDAMLEVVLVESVSSLRRQSQDAELGRRKVELDNAYKEREESLRASLAEATSELRAMRSTVSWRLTAPLRGVRRRL